MKKRYLVTSALPYANGPLHIGHLTGAYLPADIFVRYLRLMGKDVVFVCGSDEHGAAITIRARKEGKSPQEIVDKYNQILKETFVKVGINFNIYHRTSAALHHETSQDFFRTLLKNGQFEEQESEQYFDEEAGVFLADRYITGTCPNCGNENAYGDQCERCGTTLSPTELINPKSTLSGSTPIKKPTRHWYLKLNEHENWLREWVNTGKVNGEQQHDPKTWKNHVVGQCNSWLESGLQPRAMTRDLEWGVDVPQELPGAEGKKLYVWLDAPIGYISATRQWAKDNNKDWEPYWKDKDTALVHFIGKDNIVFHCLIFPAILKAHGEFILPENVPANQFLNLEGDKLSTSRNHAVWVHEFCEELPGQEDALRYNMVKNMPEQKDSEFTWKGFQETTNTELVNNLANFVNRVLVLTHKYFEGHVPDVNTSLEFQSGWNPGSSTNYTDEISRLLPKVEAVGKEIERYNFREALKSLMEISSAGNALLQFNEPWKVIKENPEEVKLVLNVGLQILAVLSVAARPFIPFAATRLRNMLQLPEVQEQGEWQTLLDLLKEGKTPLEPGHALGEAAHLFSRIPDEVIQAQLDKLAKAKENNSDEQEDSGFEPLRDTIQYDDFAKLDIRTGTVLTAEKVAKSKKLIKLEVDLGFEKRTILSGIAEYFSAEELPGKQVLVLANLAPRKMMGIESQGMVLMAEDAEGKLALVNPEGNWPNGFNVS